MRIFDFSSCPFSDRNGTYGGNSGDKEGVLIEGEPWIIKYPKKGSRLNNVVDLLKLDNDDLRKAIKRVVPLIQNKMVDICNMINLIPEKVGEFSVISKERKQLYQKEMQVRLDELLLPEFSKLISKEK